MKKKDVEVIVCPTCGNIQKISKTSFATESLTSVIQSEEDEKNSILVYLTSLFGKDKELNDANTWLDMPPCVICRNVYQYNYATKETRK